MINKKVVLSILTIFLFSIAAAATYAQFTTERISSGNAFTAGKMDLTVTQEITNVAPFKPGDSIGDQTIVVTNSGNIPIHKIDLSFVVDGHKVSDYIHGVYIKLNNQNIWGSPYSLTQIGGWPASSPLSVTLDKDIQPGEKATLVLQDLQFATDAPDSCQGVTSHISVTFHAESA